MVSGGSFYDLQEVVAAARSIHVEVNDSEVAKSLAPDRDAMPKGATFNQLSAAAGYDPGDKVLALLIIVTSQVGAMALWFSASAIAPALAAEYGLSPMAQGLLTSGVQAGYVIGSLTSALLALADRVDPRRLFAASAIVAAAANATLLVVDPRSTVVPLLRVLTGVCMAGIYPVGMKLASTWARGDMGLMVGLLVGALTLGSATPHLFYAFGGTHWRLTLAACSLSAVLAAALINLARLGPNRVSGARFQPSAVLAAWRNRSLRLANLGYLGHMWELYAMWAWIASFLSASFALQMPSDAAFYARITAFATVAVGAIGCVVGGLAADRVGRTTLTMVAMGISGTCAATIGFLFGANPWIVVVVCLVWGVSIVADSAQFSASIAELAEPRYVGTMLTIQTALGFTLTMVTIQLMPHLVAGLGWRFAFLPLALGPFVGVWAMGRLRGLPDAVRIAGGRR